MLPTKFQFIWLRGLQRRRIKCEKLTDDGRQVMAKDHSPYDKVHMVAAKRMQYHLMKCRKVNITCMMR